MSGGAKKKPAKTQGWEEAGSEFYQESYPAGDSDLDIVFQKDPQHLATLLPSKQTRVAAATTIRMRTNDTNRTFRRQQTTLRIRKDTLKPSTTTAQQDVQVSMLPDLSENISNEQTVWEEIMQIKTMPILMSQKQELKMKILNQPNLRLQGFEQFKWKRRKLWNCFRLKLKETFEMFRIWNRDLKQIEGRFGTGVVSFFVFLKWIFWMNFAIFAIVSMLIPVPYYLFNTWNNSTCSNMTLEPVLQDYVTYFECQSTYMFYGFYQDDIAYNFSLSYLTIYMACAIFSFGLIVKNGAGGFKQRLIESEGVQFYPNCESVFSGWDFCVRNVKSAQIKHTAIFNVFKTNLLSEKRKSHTLKLILVRCIINCIIFGLILISCFSVYFSFEYSSENGFDSNYFEFLPCVLMIVFNSFIPSLFKLFGRFERFTLSYTSEITFIRSVLHRISLLSVFYTSLLLKRREICWETYVGIQVFTLFVLNFAFDFLTTFFFNFPRAFFERQFQKDRVPFKLEERALDVAWNQSLIWFGVFYAPLLAFLGAFHSFLAFYLMKFACLVNSSEPQSKVYKVSRSNYLYTVLILIAFFSGVIPVFVHFYMLKPSNDCGAFRNAPYVWSVFEQLFEQTPDWVRSFAAFLTTPGFGVPVVILLLLALYYYKVLNASNSNMVNVLKNQLVLEGHDKQFLLERLSMFIKQQQESQKRLRRIEMAQEVERNRAST